MPPTRRSLGAALAALALAAVPLAVAAPRVSAATTTLTVTTATDTLTNVTCPATTGKPCSLRAAVGAAASAGGTVVITFAVPGPFVLGSLGTLIVNSGEDLTIQGSADGSTVIDGGGATRVFTEGGLGCGSPATLTLSQLTVRNGDGTVSGQNNNLDDGYGGGIDVDCANVLSVIDSTFSANVAANGGGAINDNTTAAVTVLRSTISGNTAQGSNATNGGGAFELSTGAKLLVVDSTLSGNTSAFGGGAVFAETGADLTLVNDTVSGNTGPSGAAGGIDAAANLTSSIANTIVSGNTPANCVGTLTDGGHNLEQGTSCGFSSHAINADPKLGALQDNGGPAKTMALQPGSPARDAGDDTLCAADSTASPPGAGKLDERSVTRPQGAHCDVGAFEVVATTTQLSAPTTASAGQPVTLVATVSPAQPIPGQPAGTVTFLDGTSVLGTAQLSGASPDTASFSTTVPAGGATGLLARYEGSADFLPSTSPAQPAGASPTPSSAAQGTIAAPNTGATPPPSGAPLLAGVAGAATLAATLGRRRRRR
jgi:hypothetical protein